MKNNHRKLVTNMAKDKNI